MDRPWYVVASFPLVVIGARLVVAGFRRLDAWSRTPNGPATAAPAEHAEEPPAHPR